MATRERWPVIRRRVVRRARVSELANWRRKNSDGSNMDLSSSTFVCEVRKFKGDTDAPLATGVMTGSDLANGLIHAVIDEAGGTAVVDGLAAAELTTGVYEVKETDSLGDVYTRFEGVIDPEEVVIQ